MAAKRLALPQLHACPLLVGAEQNLTRKVSRKIRLTTKSQQGLQISRGGMAA